jgi:hypothetical protein
LSGASVVRAVFDCFGAVSGKTSKHIKPFLYIVEREREREL